MVSRVKSGDKVRFQNCSFGCACSVRGGRNRIFQKKTQVVTVDWPAYSAYICSVVDRLATCARADLNPPRGGFNRGVFGGICVSLFFLDGERKSGRGRREPSQRRRRAEARSEAAPAHSYTPRAIASF